MHFADTEELATHQVEILDDGRAISLTLESRARLRFHAIWLRDNAWDTGTRALGNGQRLITIADIPSQIRISTARMEGEKMSLTGIVLIVGAGLYVFGRNTPARK
jgi:hypothetical protein